MRPNPARGAALVLTMTCALSARSADARRQAAGPLPAADAVRAVFADPPREYSTAPLWVWNDDLTEDQVLGTLRDLAAQHIRQAFVHPRPGLMTPYLSETWFRLWRLALDEAARLDMNLWIYDENSYPSGFAGGLVPEQMPESRGRGLGVQALEGPPAAGEPLAALFRLEEGGYSDVTAAFRDGPPLPAGRYLAFAVQRAGNSPWYGGRCYVDLLYPGVTQKFIDVTLEAYAREIGGEFGRRVPGVFTDEPQLRSAGELPWTDDLPAAFEQRWGYRLLEHLPALVRPLGDWPRVRHNYHALLLELFAERWGRPMYEWCAAHGLEFTGHYWEHEWTRHLLNPDPMALYAWHQRPAIDILFNQYGEDVHAQFGNVRAVRELASVANQLGRRTLCEAFGAAGWDVRLEDLKRIGDWLCVLGVNTIDQHLSYVSIRGARKRDHPESFSYHEPWWPAYRGQADYFARLCAAMAAGREVNRVLVLEPTSTLWLYTTPEPFDPRWTEIAESFQALVTRLAQEQVEFDLGCEDILARHGAADGAALRVGQARYDIVVLPPRMENLNAPTAGLLATLAAGGGSILCCGAPPTRIDGRPSDRLAALAGSNAWTSVAPEELPALLRDRAADGLVIRRAAGDAGILYHQRRRLADGALLLLVNTSNTAPSSGTLVAAARGIERWDPQTGRTEPYAFETAPEGVRAAFELPPCGSLLLALREQPRPAAPQAQPRRAAPPRTLAASTPLEIRRLAPNVLTLDYVDVTAGGETRRGLYFYQAGQFIWQKHGLDRNPWDSAVQFADELVRREFPAASGFEATYRFTIEGRVPPDLAIVIERPDLYAITCNGQAVAAAPGQWWLDKQFGRVPIAAAARVGANEVTLRASPMTMWHELESAYVLGDFALRPAAGGFTIVPPGPLKPGPWNEQGHPFYADRVAYRQTFDLAGPAGTCRHTVALPAWYGSVAEVIVGGRSAGYIGCPPYELDVSDLLAAGPNTIEVVVCGTLKNTLGPHHGNPALGIAWPTMWHKAPQTGPPPGAGYATVGYGLFQPFVLRQEEP